MRLRALLVSASSQLLIFLFAAAPFLVSCKVSTPDKGSDAISLMAKYAQRGRYDDALQIAQDWLHKHPHDAPHAATFYEQMAVIYLTKASKDLAHREEWVRQAVQYYEKDLATHEKQAIDIEFYSVGRGLEAAGDLSKANGCTYYTRAAKLFEDEVPLIQGDSYTAYGHTIPLEPVRLENQTALNRVKTKLESAGCK